MKDIYGICRDAFPRVGQEVSIGKEEEGVEPECFSNTNEYFVKLQYFFGKWEIVSAEETGIVCFVPKWFADKKILSIKIESERPKSFVGKPTRFVNGKTVCQVN